jgi:hypothetical protein
MTNTSYNVLNGFRRPEDSTSGIANDNQLYIYGTVDFNGQAITASQLANVVASNNITVYSAAGAIAISGKAMILGGTGYAMTLAAPQLGCFTDILLASITSGSVTVKTPSGVTFDGINNTATFAVLNDELIIGYASATQWRIFKNNNVTLSST